MELARVGARGRRTVVLYDGAPARCAAGPCSGTSSQRERVTRLRHEREVARADARRTAHSRATTHDLSALRAMLSTGSPLAEHSFDYVYAT